MAGDDQTLTRRRVLGGLPALTLSLNVPGCSRSAAKDHERGSQPPAPAAPAKAPAASRGESPIQAFALGAPPWPTFDPFLFCVHHRDDFPQGDGTLGPQADRSGRRLGNDFSGKDGWSMYHGRAVPGFPRHPHRGFETVTVTRRGHVDHSDSLGATARYGEGDVQWMTAGSGIVHSEMFPLLEEGKTNHAELFQIWLNLPRRSKFAKPHFSMFWRETIPRLAKLDAAGRAIEVTISAGALDGVRAPAPPPASWASQPQAEVAIWTLRLAPGARFALPSASVGVDRTLYYFSGRELSLQTAAGSRRVGVGNGVRLAASLAAELVNGEHVSEVLMLQGRPLGEPVARSGPFVMSTPEEIQEAYADYRATSFGGWPWSTPEPVHPRDSGRFAVHANGRKETAT